MSNPNRILALLAALWLAVTAHAAETVEIFAAGSLRGVVGELAKEAGPALSIDIKPSFGGSGMMRERIEKGETPDLFLSADVGSPRKLAAAGRTVVPAIAFARNRMCIMSRSSAGVTATNLIDRLLAKNVRVKTSTPTADPAGDYAWAIFDRIDTLRPGSGAPLKSKAQELMSNTATAPELFRNNQVDMSITYCSAAPTLEKDVPGLTSLVVPPQLDPHPLYGAAVLSNRPQAMRLALFLLSDKGQAIIAREGLVPLTEGAAPSAGAVASIPPQ
jgi:ABC-type molybdate transport system substrate-binding protein